MDRREIDLDFRMPSQAEIDARVREAHDMRSAALAQGVTWVFRRAHAGLRWLFGVEWEDAERTRKDELSLRFLRASSPAHIEPTPARPPMKDNGLASAGVVAARLRARDAQPGNRAA